MNKLITLFLVTSLTLLTSLSVNAANVTGLLMPGPLVEGHAKFENDCKRCHQLFSEEPQRRLCLDCHKLVAADIQAKQGFHGKSKNVGQSECRVCHTDHTGRNADIVLLDVETFDHQNTDFDLKGPHLRIHCSGCHNPKLIKAEVLNKQQVENWELRKHRNAPGLCIDCHKKDEPHQGRLGEKCQDCHQSEQWTKNNFKHKNDKFELKGAHQKVACSLCHPNQRWSKIPKDCYSCHRLNDRHAGRYGGKCETCHSPTGDRRNSRGEDQSPWKTILFDHGKTKFQLLDKHLQVQCDRCHTGPLYNQKLSFTCFSCHQAEDQHRGRFGNKCESCHKPTGWKQVKYDHDKTKFPLRDKHATVVCNKCHTGPTNGNKLPSECYSCHHLDDVHRGEQGKKCETCHSPKGWHAEVSFEHDLTRFPLIGMHAVAPCEACHTEPAFKNTPRDCINCHKKSDEHKQRLGDNCSGCHNPNGWAFWKFEHDTQSKFRLEGAHESLDCLACHREPVKEKISMAKACASCHLKDDAHRGGFGKNCERCHITKAFNQIRIMQ